MAKANLLIEVMSLATSIALLAPNADLLPSAECSYAPHRWWWFKNNLNNKTTKNKHQRTPKSLSLNSLKPLAWNSWCLQICVPKVTLTQSAHLPQRGGHPQSRTSSGADALPSWCWEKTWLYHPGQPLALSSQHGTGQAAIQAVDCSQTLPSSGKEGWPLWEGAPSYRSLLRPALSLPVLSWGWQFKQALSLCIQSRFMRADKDVT